MAASMVDGLAYEERLAAEGLLGFIKESPSMFHTVRAIRSRLDEAGFVYLPEVRPWECEPGGSYYTVRNNSSIIAFKVGSDVRPACLHFQIAASHSDSPTFKLKANPALEGPGPYARLNVEAYGGMIDYTWFDRPLSVAGRVMVETENRIESMLVSLDDVVAIIPSLAIHMDHSVNSGFAPNRKVDLCPLFSAGALSAAAFDELLAGRLGVRPQQVLGRDVFLVNRQEPIVWGAEDEFVSAPKLDDLMCAYASLDAFLHSSNPGSVSVFCCFDNEEVGSNTMQGALSTFLPDTLQRLNAALGGTDEMYRRALAASMLVSCDNAHAVHPNHPEKCDEGNRTFLNRGIVVKEAANQKYCTDAFSRAVFCAVCNNAGVPFQRFANRSDMAGGSTLGNLSNMQASIHGVDVGCAQLAMHSAYETAGARDVLLAVRAIRAFYDADLDITSCDGATLG